MDESWKVWGFTSVIYRHGDAVAFVMGLLSLVPQILIVAFVASNLSAFHRSNVQLHVGLAISEGINFVLKSMIRQRRPEHPCSFAGRSDFGFPSSHAQFMFFVATRSVLAFAWRRSHLQKTKGKVHHPIVALMVACGFALLAVLVCVSRVWNHYHTTEQVVAGAVVGVVLGVLSFRAPLNGWINTIVDRVALPILKAWYRFAGIEGAIHHTPAKE